MLLRDGEGKEVTVQCTETTMRADDPFAMPDLLSQRQPLPQARQRSAGVPPRTKQTGPDQERVGLSSTESNLLGDGLCRIELLEGISECRNGRRQGVGEVPLRGLCRHRQGRNQRMTIPEGLEQGDRLLEIGDALIHIAMQATGES